MSRNEWKLVHAGKGHGNRRVFTLSADRDRMMAVVEVAGSNGARNSRVTATIRHVAHRAHAKAEGHRLIAGIWDCIGDHQTEHAKDPDANSSATIDQTEIVDSKQDPLAVIVDVYGDDAIWLACSHFGDEIMNEVV